MDDLERELALRLQAVAGKLVCEPLTGPRKVSHDASTEVTFPATCG